MTAEAPRRLGPYRLDRVLGRGGMGVVYAAYDERLDRRVAIKRVLTEDDDPRRRRRLRREARVAAQLSHPAIVQVYDLVEGDDEAQEAAGDWIVMELVEGRPLSELLAAGPLGIERTLAYGRQIAEGLAAAHDRGIVHRDLKTENVMVLSGDPPGGQGGPSHGQVKILDFGLAKRLDRLPGDSADAALTVAGQILGTGRAMSPEQARGLEVGPRSDLFSLGTLLYECLTGVSPFRGETPHETLIRVATHPPSPVHALDETIPPELSDLIGRLLCKAPERRPASAREVAGELTELAEERRFQARSASSPSGPETEATRTQIDDELPARPEMHPGPSSGLSTLKGGMGLVLPLVVLVLAVVAGYLWWPFGSKAPEPAPSVPSLPEADALAPGESARLYDEAMEAVRRPDRPEGLDRAVDIFQRLLESDEGSAPAHAGLARAYWEKAVNPAASGDPVFLEQAAAAAQEAVRLDPQLADARVSLGLVEHARGQPDEARHQLETALELDPTSAGAHADAHYGLARVAASEGRQGEAENEYRQALGLHPRAMYWDALGAQLYSQGRYGKAEEAFLASLALAPDNVYALRNLGVVYYAQGRLDEAATKLEATLEIRPDASLTSNLGTIYFTRGLYARAAATFERALGLGGAANNFVYWLNLADAYRQLPDKEEETQRSYRRAIQLLGESLEAAPEDVRLWSRRAVAHARAGSCSDARDDLDRIRGLGMGENVYSLLRVAVVEELCGEREPALATLEAALRAGLAESEVRHEPDLLELRADPRFHHLLMALEGR